MAVETTISDRHIKNRVREILKNGGHRSTAVVGFGVLSSKSPHCLPCGMVFPKCESDPNTSPKRLLLLLDPLHILLFLFYLCVLRHILKGCKIIIIPSVYLRVQCRHERRIALTKRTPWYLVEERVDLKLGECGIATRRVGDETVTPSM